MASYTYLHVSVQDLAIVQRLQSTHYLYEYVPDLLLFDVRFALLVTANLLEDVTIICVLHDETKCKFVIPIKRDLINLPQA
jgi:hypothetical protein